VASRRHGIVTTAELYAVGLTRHAVARRVGSGWLTRRHRGVFLVGAAVATWADEAAALAACGPRALLSHRSAAMVWGLCDRGDDPTVDVSIPGTAPRGHEGRCTTPGSGLLRVTRWEVVRQPEATIARLARAAAPRAARPP
jgi:hypothetical protein